MFDSSMTAAAIAKRVQELQAAAGIKAQLVNPAGRGAGIITLTGWVALAALASLVVVIVGGSALAYRRWTGKSRAHRSSHHTCISRDIFRRLHQCNAVCPCNIVSQITSLFCLQSG